jgi:hypothetical protein
MKKESVIENCERLRAFLKDEYPNKYEGNKNGDFTPKYLLDIYGRILDVHGCPQSGLSKLFLSHEDYSEMEDWAVKNLEPHIYTHIKETKTEPLQFGGNEIGTIPVLKIACIGFVYNGYQWYIQKPQP